MAPWSKRSEHSRRTCPLLLARSLFFEVDQVTNGADVGSVGDVLILFCFVENWRRKIVPAQFGNEAVPDKEVAFVQTPSVRITPIENFFVGPSGQNAVAQIAIFYTQKVGTALGPPKLAW